MFSNYRNRSLIYNMGYQDRVKPMLDPLYRIPMKSIHGQLLQEDHKQGDILNFVDGVQVGGGMIENMPDTQNISTNDILTGSVDAAKALYTAYQTAKNIATNETFMQAENIVRNTLGSFQNQANPNWRPGFPGERHMVTKTGVSYNYLGPGTHIEERLARKDPPLDGAFGLDAAAQQHDIDYYNATTAQDIRAADKTFLDKVDKTEAGRLSKRLVKGLMKAKMLGEDVGLIGVQQFTDLPNLGKTGEDIKKLDVIGQGAAAMIKKQKGRGRKKDPAARLRKKVLTK